MTSRTLTLSSMHSGYMLAIGSVFDMHHDLVQKNNEKLKEIEKKYLEAASLPRKIKKKVRKKLESDYAFFRSLREYEKQMFDF